MTFEKQKTAIIGTGMISPVYFNRLQRLNIIDLVACADIRTERAVASAEKFGVVAKTNEEIFADPDIKLVINTTYPLSHYEVAKAALLAGKHVYTEKMVAESVEQMDELIALAEEKGLYFGGAPDTFLCGAAQTARQLIDAGVIGTPTVAEAFLSRSYHHERNYTSDYKRFAFCRHGGIIFDMGSYYLSELVFLLGSIDKVFGFAQTRDADRKYQNPKCPLFGEDMTVETPNNVTGSLLFKNGTIATITMSSEAGTSSNRFVIHGTDGMIDLGDPNQFSGEIKVYNKAGKESIIQTNFAFFGEDFRGLGAADAMYALKNGRKPRCSGELSRHVLEAALGICESGENGTVYEMRTTCERPEPFKPGYTEYPELVLDI